MVPHAGFIESLVCCDTCHAFEVTEVTGETAGFQICLVFGATQMQLINKERGITSWGLVTDS